MNNPTRTPDATNSMSVPGLNSGNGVEPSSQVRIGLSDAGLINPTAIVRQRNADMPTTTSTPNGYRDGVAWMGGEDMASG